MRGPGGHVDVHSGRQVGRAVGLCRERRGLSIRDTGRDRAQADAEGRETGRAVAPALSESCGSNERAPRLALIPGPPQLQQGVSKVEPAVGGALTGVRIERAFGQSESHEQIRFPRIKRGTDEHVIQLHRHGFP